MEALAQSGPLQLRQLVTALLDPIPNVVATQGANSCVCHHRKTPWRRYTAQSAASLKHVFLWDLETSGAVKFRCPFASGLRLPAFRKRTAAPRLLALRGPCSLVFGIERRVTPGFTIKVDRGLIDALVGIGRASDKQLQRKARWRQQTSFLCWGSYPIQIVFDMEQTGSFRM